MIRFAPKEDLQRYINYLNKNKKSYQYYDEYPLPFPELEMTFKVFGEMLLHFVLERNKK
jgi:hypothetical protein